MNTEKDVDLRVENDSREFIGANRHLIVTTNQQELAGDIHMPNGMIFTNGMLSMIFATGT